MGVVNNGRPRVDDVTTQIAEYLSDYAVDSAAAFDAAHLRLIDTLGCAFEGLGSPECAKLLGPLVPGTIVPYGARVPGTAFELDPIKAAFDIGSMARWFGRCNKFCVNGHLAGNCRPVCGRVCRYDHVCKPPPAVFDDNENVQQLKGSGDGDKKIAGQYRPCVIPQESRPALITTGLTEWSLRHVLADSARGDPNSQFDQQLIGDPLFAPHWVLGGHFTNQRSQFRWNRRSTPFALESPKQSPTRSVPADDRFRTHDYDCVPPIEQAGEKCEADTSDRIDAPRLDPAFNVLGQLLSEHSVLGTHRQGRTQLQ